MRLTDLEPEWRRYEQRDGHIYHVTVDTIAEAQGIEFLCPKCRDHHVVCWSRTRGVPDDARPGPGRWTLEGTGFHDLTLNGDPGARSIDLKGGCRWHGYITNGEVSDA